jgi:hypothetical protein
VDELLSPLIGVNHCFTLVFGGVRAPIDRSVSAYGDLIQAVVDRVTEAQLPRAMAKIQAGKSARFGPFAVSFKGLRYKDRSVRWKEVGRKSLQVGLGRRLTVYREGGMFSFCWHDLNRVPNDNTFYRVLCETAPEHLLVRNWKIGLPD